MTPTLPTLFVPGSLRDPSGIYDTPLQKKLDSIKPIDYCISWFKDRLPKTGLANRLLILKAGTASSKSTGFVAEMYMAIVLLATYGRRGLICTQPRILTAIKNVSQIVSVKAYSHLKIGQDIGWSTQYDKMKPKRFGILSATVGTLTAQMSMSSDSDILDMYQMICVDETHERNLQTDSVILMLYNFMRRNAHDPRCPFIVFMSATFEPQVFIDYFGGIDPEVSLMNNFIHVVGQSVGYSVNWPESIDPKKKIWQLAAETVNTICREGSEDTDDSCDILIFMPGAHEIEETEKALKPIVDALFAENFGACAILAISGKAIEDNTESYKNLDRLNGDIKLSFGTGSDKRVVAARRKIVISTVIAETGLTLDQLKYVIETGYHRATVFNPNFAIDTLLTESAPKSRVTQRFGRVGRKTRGIVYPLYTKDTYDLFVEQQFPEIIVDDFSDILLSVIMEQIKDASGSVDITKKIDINGIRMLTDPPAAKKQMAYERAYKLGLIEPDNTDIRLTKIGAVSAKLSMSLTSARLLASGHIFGYSVYDLVSLVSVLDIASGRDFEKTNWTNIYESMFGSSGAQIRALMSDDYIDIIVLMNLVLRQFDHGIPDFVGFCKEKKLNHDTLKNILVRRDQLLMNMLTLGYSLGSGVSICPKNNVDNDMSTTNNDIAMSYIPDMETLTRLKYCLHDSFKTNVLELVEGSYRHKGIKVSVPHFKRSEILALTGVDEVIFPKYLVFDYLSGVVQGGRLVVTAYRVSTMSGYCYLDTY